MNENELEERYLPYPEPISKEEFLDIGKYQMTNGDEVYERYLKQIQRERMRVARYNTLVHSIGYSLSAYEFDDFLSMVKHGNFENEDTRWGI